MESEIARVFLDKYVKLVRQMPNEERPFKLFGTIEKVTDESLLIRTDKGLGAVRLIDVVQIVEWVDYGGGSDGKS